MFDRQKQLSIVQRTFRKAMRNIINNIYRKYSVPEKWVEYRGQDASDIIEAGLKSDKPLMVARLGGIELDAMIRINNNNSKFKFLPNKKRDGIFDSLASNAGFFPLDDALLKKFYELMYADLHCVDILGSWRRREIFFKKELRAAKKIYLADIEPYLHINPWSKALKGKKVLVVHPFSESIREQYARRSYLFDNKDVLPDSLYHHRHLSHCRIGPVGAKRADNERARLYQRFRDFADRGRRVRIPPHRDILGELPVHGRPRTEAEKYSVQ